MIEDRPLRGIALMLGFCCLGALTDALAKLIGARVPVLQLVFLRFAFQAALLMPLCLVRARGPGPLMPALGPIALRSALHIAGIAMMYAGLRHLPLADAVAIAYVMPFILLLLGGLLLGEPVGARRWLACVVGFTGGLLILQPSLGTVGAPALFPLGVAVSFALFMLLTRQLSARVDPITLQALSGAIACLLLLPLVLGDLDRLWDLAPQVWALVAVMGFAGTAGHLLMTWSLKYAPTTVLAPIQYVEIPIAAALGLAMFGDFPTPVALIGIALTMAAGLYVIALSRPAPGARPARR